MKQITQQMSDVLFGSGEHEWAELFTITPTNGAPIRLTSRDGGLTSGSYTYSPAVISKPSSQRQLGTEADTVEVEVAPGNLTMGGVPFLQAVRSGVLDGAEVRVDRAVLVTGTLVGTVESFWGYVDSFNADPHSVRINAGSLLTRLNAKFPTRKMSAAGGCPFKLYGPECGVNSSSFTTLTITDVGSTPDTVVLTGPCATASPFGTLTVAQGPLSGTSVQIRSVSGPRITLAEPLSISLPSYTTVLIRQGCSKSTYGCATFNNTLRFGGCPGMPVNSDKTPKDAIDRIFTALGYTSDPKLPHPASDGRTLPVVLGTGKVKLTQAWLGQKVDSYLTYTYPSGPISGNGSPTPRTVFIPEHIAAVLAACAAPVSGVRSIFIGEEQIPTGSIGNGYVGWQRLTVDPSGNNPASTSMPTGSLYTTGTPVTSSWTTGLASGVGYNGMVTWRSEYTRLDGNTHKLPDIAFEVQSLGCEPSKLDMRPDALITQLLVSGAGIPASAIDTTHGPDGLYRSSYAAFLDSVPDFRVSRVLEEGQPVADLVKGILEATQADPVWTGSKLRILPRWDTPTGSYVPPTASIMLDQNEIILEDGGVVVDSPPAGDTFNMVALTYRDRGNLYEDHTITMQDDYDVDVHGVRQTSDVRSDWITTTSHAFKVASMMVQYGRRPRKLLKVRVAPRWIPLEPGDTVLISDGQGLSNQRARIERIREDERGRLEIEAREWGVGICTPIDFTPDVPDGNQPLPYVDHVIETSIQNVSGTASGAYASATVAFTAAASASATASQAQVAAGGAQAAATAAATSAALAQTIAVSVSSTIYDPAMGLAQRLLNTAGSVTANNLASGSVTVGALAANAVTANAIAANAVGANAIAAGAITAAKLDANAISTTNFTTGSNGYPSSGSRMSRDANNALMVAPNSLIAGSLTIEQHLEEVQLADITRLLGTNSIAGSYVSLDPMGGNWIMPIDSQRLMINGTAYTATGLYGNGDAVWSDYLGAWITVDPGGWGIKSVTVAGAITQRSTAGALSICEPTDINGVNTVVALTEAIPANSSIWYSTNGGSTWNTATHPATTNVVWQSVCSLGYDSTNSYARGFLAVGNDNSTKAAVVCWSPNGSTWYSCTIPGNGSNIVPNPRTSATSQSCQGIVCGRTSTAVVIMVNSWIWVASLGSDLRQPSSWTQISNTSVGGVGAIPQKAKSTGKWLMVQFQNWYNCMMTRDGKVWTWVTPSSCPGLPDTQSACLAIGVANDINTSFANLKYTRSQFAAVVGARGGKGAVYASGVAQVFQW